VCRHLAYVGPPVRLGALLADPPHSLVRQSWEPRRQTHGVVNADGFGVGWYAEGDPVPARHRGSGPIWADETFADLARVVRSRAVLAAVRSATAGSPPGTAAAAPFRQGPWLFSHNGAVDDWPASADALLGGLPPRRWAATGSTVDSTALWALALEQLESGASAGKALGETVRHAQRVAGGRFNLMLLDGARITATRCGATLSWRPFGGGVIVASEPHDDDPAWQEVPERHLVQASPDGVRVSPL
jgi:glutamine amidotransferase